MEYKVLGPARTAAILVALAAVVAPVAGAQTIQWTDWTQMNVGTPGSAMGTIHTSTGDIAVSYTGQVLAGSQTSTGGTAYFDPNGSHPFSATTYAGGAAPNGPGTNPGFVQLQGATGLASNTLTFSSPVDNLFFSVISLGQTGSTVSYAFDQPFSIEAQGAGWWGTCSAATCLTQSADQKTLMGTEGDGTLMFQGPVTSVTWTAAPSEYWHGFTVGAESTVPEPSSLALLGTGLFGLVPMVRRRKR